LLRFARNDAICNREERSDEAIPIRPALMLRKILTPIHPDGWKFIAAAALMTLILFLLWHPAGWAGLILTLWMAYFFRDPWRVTPSRPGLIVSPADGIVVALGPASPPPELEMGRVPVPRIGIFLNLFDVHVARAPVGGRVAARRYTKGRFVNASLDKASLDNERLTIRVAPEEGPEIAFVLIAGLVARRIVCPLYEGQRLAVGERIGLIRFGSRVDIYIPPPYVPLVALGQRMVAGETVLADRRKAEPANGGLAH
jgi:phosphatidylserine decarboxylase